MFGSSLFSRNVRSASPAMMQTLEGRTMFAAVAPEAVKVVDTGGPIQEMVEAGGQIYVTSPLASGGSTLQLWVTDGIKKHTTLLLDLSQPGSKLSAIGQLTATEDGRVFFTASATGGRHLFELNTANGKVHQVSTGTSKFYDNVTAAGNRLFFFEGNGDAIFTIAPGAVEATEVTQLNIDSEFRAAGNVVYFIGPDESVWRSDGTAGGTVKISGDYTVGRNDFFATNEFVVFEGNKAGENTSLFIVGASATSPVKVADDFSLYNIERAEVGGWVYFSGGYYNTSPNANGRQLYRVNADGVVQLASKVAGNGGQATGISAIGNYVYFVANDGENLPSQGMGDQELYKYNTLTGETKLVTDDNDLFPIEVGGGALTSYFFVAAPTKDNARFGSRALYRTNPVTDEIEIVQGLPTVLDLSQKPYQKVRDIAVGARGFFFTADTDTNGRDTDVFFSLSPFSVLDPATSILTIQGTDFADETSMTVIGDELVITQNGVEERYPLASVGRIEAFLKAGNDHLTTDPSVLINTYVFGDLGDDNITTGSGRDTITGGAGKNFLYGGDGDDRLNGSGGRDFLDGQDGADRMYGNAGNDIIHGGLGVDRAWGGLGDDLIKGGSSNDKLAGEEGNDTILGDKQSDLLLGGAGDDYIEGDVGLDTIDGGEGADVLIGNEDDDVFFANDLILDSIYGGDGNDTATADPTEALLDLVEVLL